MTIQQRSGSLCLPIAQWGAQVLDILGYTVRVALRSAALILSVSPTPHVFGIDMT